MDKFATLVGIILAAVVLSAGLMALFAVLLMWAWAGFMVPVLGLPLLSFYEAFCGTVLLTMVAFVFRARAHRVK